MRRKPTDETDTARAPWAIRLIRKFPSHVAVLTTAIILTACDPRGMRQPMRGYGFDPTLPKPEFVATAMDGSTFDFRKQTDGDVALLFFGYTHCPDLCPNHMHNLAAVLRKMNDADARRVHVVFVTTDPARDTEARLREWLGGIHPRIIGVRPTQEDAIRIQSALHMQPAIVYEAKAGHDGNYEVGHSAQVIAFTPDNQGRFGYAAGTRQTDWAHDIPLLLKRRWGK